MDSIIAQLEADLQLLKRKLEETDIFKDIQALERVIRLQKAPISRERPQPISQPKSHNARPELSTISVMKRAVENYLSGKTEPVSTKEIYDALVGVGIQVPGENPTNNLSAHMSRDSQFMSWGRDGWTLTSSVTPLGEKIAELGAEFLKALDDVAKDGLESSFLLSSEIAPDTDRELLRFARQRIGRHLLESEKRELRKAIEELL